MRFLDLINDINWGKNITFLLLYICIVIACVYFYLIPTLDTYKIANSEYKKANSLNTQVEASLNQLDKSKAATLKANEEVFSNLREKVSLDALREYASKYFYDIKLQAGESKSLQDDIQTTSIKIYAKSKGIDSIIAFIKNLDMLKASIRASFPLVIKKQDGYLSLEITLIIYNSSYSF